MFNRYFLNSSSAPKITPALCGHRVCPPGWHIDRAYLGRHNIHYVVRGTGVFVKNGMTHHIRAGDLFICRPGEEASYTASIQDPWYYIWVSFECSPEFDAVLQQDVINFPAAARLFLQMVDERCSAREWMVWGSLYQLFAMLAADQAAPATEKNFITQAVDFIEENYSRSLQVTELADRLGLSRNYFCRSFKRQTGQSPQDYIISLRLEKAAQMLANSDLTQKEIAQRVGYPDVYAFSRMFKRRYGIAPGQYKNARHVPSTTKEE